MRRHQLPPVGRVVHAAFASFAAFLPRLGAQAWQWIPTGLILLLKISDFADFLKAVFDGFWPPSQPDSSSRYPVPTKMRAVPTTGAANEG